MNVQFLVAYTTKYGARRRMQEAASEEQFQAIGFLSRQVMISLNDLPPKTDPTNELGLEFSGGRSN